LAIFGVSDSWLIETLSRFIASGCQNGTGQEGIAGSQLKGGEVRAYSA
jgi:hypothetical protein